MQVPVKIFYTEHISLTEVLGGQEVVPRLQLVTSSHRSHDLRALYTLAVRVNYSNLPLLADLSVGSVSMNHCDFFYCYRPADYFEKVSFKFKVKVTAEYSRDRTQA